jgi:hypothetical protein
MNVVQRLKMLVLAKLTVQPLEYTINKLKDPNFKEFYDLITGDNGWLVNGYLNNGKIPVEFRKYRSLTPTFLKNKIKGIDNIFDKNIYPHQGGMLHRYMHTVNPEKFQEGKTYTQHGYMHTTNKPSKKLWQDLAIEYSNKKTLKPTLLMHLKLPKNHPIINASLVGNEREQEHVLPRGSRYTVTKIIHTKGKPSHLYGTILPYEKPTKLGKVKLNKIIKTKTKTASIIKQ